MRWWNLALVGITVGSLTTACSKNNPGWLASASEGSTSIATMGSTTTVSETTTQSATTTTTTTAGSTTGDPLACPEESSNYCPFITDVADAPNAASCDGVDAYSAYRDGTSFYRCDGVCDADSCTELVITMPDLYTFITDQLDPCIQVEHEQKWLEGTCRTRSLALWSAGEDVTVIGPRIILAAHEPEPPPSLTDLKVEVGEDRILCDCGSCDLGFTIDPKHWCCDGQLSLGNYRITNDAAAVFRASYTKYPSLTTVKYRGESYNFVITQSHDGATDCAGDLTFKAGWYMQRS